MYHRIQARTPRTKKIVSTKLGNAAGTILLKFIFIMYPNNIVYGTPASLIEECNLTPWDFKQGIQELKRLDCIRKYTKQEYMLNPDIVFNGDDRKYWVTKNIWDTQTSKGLKK